MLRKLSQSFQGTSAKCVALMVQKTIIGHRFIYLAMKLKNGLNHTCVRAVTSIGMIW